MLQYQIPWLPEEGKGKKETWATFSKGLVSRQCISTLSTETGSLPSGELGK